MPCASRFRRCCRRGASLRAISTLDSRRCKLSGMRAVLASFAIVIVIGCGGRSTPEPDAGTGGAGGATGGTGGATVGGTGGTTVGGSGGTTIGGTGGTTVGGTGGTTVGGTGATGGTGGSGG